MKTTKTTRSISLDELVERLEQRRGENSLVSALRIYAVSYYRSATKAKEAGATLLHVR